MKASFEMLLTQYPSVHTPKINDGKQYIRLAIRKKADNDRIIEAFKAF